jgi:hypothetical protein
VVAFTFAVGAIQVFVERNHSVFGHLHHLE